MLIAHWRYLIDRINHKIRLVSALPMTILQMSFLGGSLKDARFIGTDITITTEFRICDITYLSIKLRFSIKMTIIKKPYSPFSIRHRHYRQAQIGILTPSFILQTIDAHAVYITRLTIVCRIQRHTIHLKTNMAMVIFLDHSKHRPVGCLHSPVGITAIEGTCKSILTIHTNNSIALWEILLHTSLILFSIIIRL